MLQVNKKGLAFIIMFTFFFLASMSYADRVKRPMAIHKVKRMGLEIWTEMEPQWNAELMMNGKKPIFVAHTPNNVYPPSGMMWVNDAGVVLEKGEFPQVAQSTLQQAARNYGVKEKELSSLDVRPATYGDLKGFEVSFKGNLENKVVDVKVFTGRYGGKGPITMQVYAPLGKLGHMTEQIRRSWSHSRYLNE